MVVSFSVTACKLSFISASVWADLSWTAKVINCVMASSVPKLPQGCRNKLSKLKLWTIRQHTRWKVYSKVECASLSSNCLVSFWASDVVMSTKILLSVLSEPTAGGLWVSMSKGKAMSLLVLQTCDFFVTFSSRSLCSSVYPLCTFSLLSLYLCLFTLSSPPDFIHFTCLLSFHMLLAFYHMHTIFHMLTVITCLPFITCYFIYLDYKIPAVIRRP